MINTSEFYNRAKNFCAEMNYQQKGRNWGNKWHSLCSYRGKLKPAIANELIVNFTEKDDTVLDPMGGVGTIAFEAILNGRKAISNDLSKFAAVVTQAKLNPVTPAMAEKDLRLLEKFIEHNKEKYANNDEVRSFGLNKKIIDYYHHETLKEILACREFFNIKKNYTNSEAFILSCMLHILHGNRPYALSRISHPLTPYAPTGDFIYKNVIQQIKNKMEIMYNSKDFYYWGPGKSTQFNAINLSEQIDDLADIIISSPPFASSFKFYTQNWLRLWFIGWTPDDFKAAKDIYFDEKQNQNLDIYKDYFCECYKLLKPSGKLILHVGKSKKINMATELLNRADDYFNLIYLADEDVRNVENHGVVDKGSTTDHQFLFLEKK
jgi:hypothetical protein